VDGGAKPGRFRLLSEAGAEMYVLGSALFNNQYDDLEKAFDAVYEAYQNETGKAVAL